jgi:hypothetical protein
MSSEQLQKLFVFFSEAVPWDSSPFLLKVVVLPAHAEQCNQKNGRAWKKNVSEASLHSVALMGPSLDTLLSFLWKTADEKSKEGELDTTSQGN